MGNLQFLRQLPLGWAFWWLVIPNFVAIAMWPIGGPSMASAMFVTGVIAYLCSQRGSNAVKIAVISGMIIFNIATYIAASFNLTLYNLVLATRLATELNPIKSPEYVAAGIAAIVCLALAIRFAPRTRQLASPQQKAFALVLLFALVGVDTIATARTRGSYHVAAPAGAPVDSAIRQNHVTPDGVTARNFVVIIVESLGMPAAQEDKAIFTDIWNPSRWSNRYDVSQGKNLYYGSTTNAEVREWCDSWSDHESFDFDRSHCLPEAFRENGFHTIALHSFTGEFFDRKTWYRKIGFESTIFYDNLKDRVQSCSGVFPGACDRDVPPIIGDVLRKSKNKRNLVYWLTVNAHLPVVEDAQLRTKNCNLATAEWRRDFPSLCRQLMLHRQVSDAVTAEIMRPDFPEADILIVGDHMPPFFPSEIRARFDSTSVPWIYLRNRAAQERTPRS